MPRHILALKLVADDVSSVHDIRNGRDVLDKMVSILKSTTPPHEVTAEPSTVKHGTTEFSRVYYKQTFPGVTHFYCTEATVLKGYALRVSAIADSQPEADEACAMANTLEFY